ncbi:hypothetical protein Rleg_5115 (plasmid) [Rhizobium leguminosarum bv. trifolii WSM1325]|uniref:Uncharacterized protein n=1 Tax=Rhizobium leguminosarum bv. trifolii (strain WSM1325) TaxID=395491 RepID=C6B5H0_RHILS|nr:hypothetical protein [Rhizobium leguminosarum]ACS59328.1 hypothetical protein Rleg_5115 [Rhizobium leguminosarum bv. trifolii WSM1325]
MLARPAGYAGAAIAALWAACQIGRLYSSTEPFGPELMNVARNLGIFILPALVLLLAGPFRMWFDRFAPLYPFVLGAGILNIYVQDDALAAGLPMIVLVYPFLVIFALGSRPDDHRRGHGRTEHHFFAAWRQGHGERLAIRRGVSQTPLPEAGFANLPLHPFSGKSE